MRISSFKAEFGSFSTRRRQHTRHEMFAFSFFLANPEQPTLMHTPPSHATPTQARHPKHLYSGNDMPLNSPKYYTAVDAAVASQRGAWITAWPENEPYPTQCDQSPSQETATKIPSLLSVAQTHLTEGGMKDGTLGGKSMPADNDVCNGH